MAIFKTAVQPKPIIATGPASSTMAAIAQLAPAHMARSMAIFHRIYVGSIQFDITDADLTLLFSQFGPVASISMIQDPVHRRHKGYGFIEFETPEGAALAQQQMDGAELGGRTIKVGRPNNFPSDLPVGVPRPKDVRIYIANIHELVTEDELRLVCEAFGTISECRMAWNSKTGKHKGYAIVEYKEVSSALAALEGLHNFELAKRLLKVGKTITGNPLPSLLSPTTSHNDSFIEAERKKVMLLKNLEDFANLITQDSITELESDVREECERFGCVESCKVVLDRQHQTVTVHVHFSSEEECAQAVQTMHHRWFAGRQIIAEAVAKSS